MAEPEELFTKAQKSEIIFQYSKLGSATFVWRRFRNHYPNIPNSRIPSVRTFSRLIQRFKDTGSRKHSKKGIISGHKAETMTKENIETICQMIEDNNSLSINCIACEVGIDKKMFGSFSRRS